MACYSSLMKNSVAKKFLKGAVIMASMQVFIFASIFVPFYAAWGFPHDVPFFQDYKAAFWNLKEIMMGFVIFSAVCGGVRELMRAEN